MRFPGRADWDPALLALPAVLFVLMFGVWPLLSFLFGGVRSPDGLTLANFAALLQDDVFVSVAARTLTVAITVTAICLLLAYPLAYALTKARGAGKTVLLALVVLPYLTSVLVRVYAWAALLALDGPVNGLLLRLGLVRAPLLLGHGTSGTIIGMTHVLLPIAALTLWSRLEKIDPAQQITAATLGASRSTSFATVFVPQSLPGVAAAGTLVYILALGAYVIPATLGGTKGLLFAQLVVDQATQLLNWELSGAMGLAMLGFSALPVLLLATIRGLAGLRRERPAMSRRQVLAARYLYPVLERVPDTVFRRTYKLGAAAILAFLILPEIAVLLFSLGPVRHIAFPPTTMSLAGYQTVLADPGWTIPLQRSLIYAALDATIATILGALAAYGFVRGGARWARIGTAALLLPVVLPEIVAAIAYFIFASNWSLTGSDAGIVLGQAVGIIGLVVLITTAVIREVDVSLEWAAQACGASRLRTLLDIVVPLILPGLVVAFAYAFLHALDNLVTPLFIAGTKTTVTMRMFLSMQEELTSAPAVIASLLIACLVLGIAVALIYARFSRVKLVVPVADA